MNKTLAAWSLALLITTTVLFLAGCRLFTVN